MTSEHLEKRVDKIEGEVDALQDLKTAVALNNQSQSHVIERLDQANDNTGRICKLVEDHVTEDKRRFEQIDQVLFRGTDKDDPLLTRVSRLESFKRRGTKWAAWLLTILSGVIVAIVAAIVIQSL